MKTNRPALRHGYLILASMALASSPVLAQTQAAAGTSATTAVIFSVAITQAPQRAAVRVEGEGRLDVHAGRMQNPDRLVLDFAGARLAVQKTVIPGISAPVRGSAYRAIPSGCRARGHRSNDRDALPSFPRRRSGGHLLRDAVNDSGIAGVKRDNFDFAAE